MRIHVELKRDAVPQVALNKLFKHTSLQSTFGYNAVALVDGVPKTLSLLELIRHYLDFQREVVTRRSKDELRKAESRAHVLEGYLIALDKIDAIVALIRAASDTDDARTQLMERSRSPRSRRRRSSTSAWRAHRARAEGDRGGVQGPAGADRRAARDPRRPGPHRRRYPRGAARDQADLRQADDRRTEIVARGGGARARGPDRGRGHGDRDHAVGLHQAATGHRVPRAAARRHRRDGHGLKDDDYIEHLFVASTHDYILFFTSVGKVYRLKVHELPLGSRQSKGRAIVNCYRSGRTSRCGPSSRRATSARRSTSSSQRRTASSRRRSSQTYNTTLKADGIIAIKMREGDELVGVRHSSGDDDILMVQLGQAIRFHEKQAARWAATRPACRACACAATTR